MKQCDMSQNIPMPNGRNAISNMGQEAMGIFYNADHVRANQTETQGFQLFLCFLCLGGLFFLKSSTVQLCVKKKKKWGSLAQPH